MNEQFILYFFILDLFFNCILLYKLAIYNFIFSFSIPSMKEKIEVVDYNLREKVIDSL
jgi:hypothetical protein